jgi:hypothetical protein
VADAPGPAVTGWTGTGAESKNNIIMGFFGGKVCFELYY